MVSRTEDDASIPRFIQTFFQKQLQRSELHPDAWEPIIIRDPRETRERLAKVAGDKYSYADLDDFSDLIARTVQGAPETSKVERRGVLPQMVYLEYSEARLAAYGLQPAALGSVLSARNIIAPGGAFETGQQQVILNPSGQFENIDAIGNVAVSASSTGAPVYLRDLVEISRGYQSPAQYLNYYTWEDPKGQWQRSRSVTLAIYMRDQRQIAAFGQSVDQKLAQINKILPPDLIIAHTSDQPLQVKENIHLFLRALYEAIGPCRYRFFDWVLGMASGAHHGPGNSHHAGDDLWRFVHVGNRLTTGLSSNVNNCAGPVGGCARRSRRWNQTWSCRWLASCHRGMARSDQAGDGNLFRDAHEYHRLPAFSYADREHRGVSSEPSHRDDCSVAMCAGSRDDIRPAAGLLHSEATEKERTDGRGKATARFLWFLQPPGRPGHSAPVVGVGRFTYFPADWGIHGFASEATVLSRRCPILVLPRHLAAERCAADRNKRRCLESGAGRPSGC